MNVIVHPTQWHPTQWHLPHLTPGGGGRLSAALRAPSASTIGRTLAVAGYLVALVVAGRPGWLAAVLAVALIALWVLPLTRRHRRPPSTGEPGVQDRQAPRRH